MTSPKGRGRKTPELRVTAELNALTSAGLSHLTAELGNPSSPRLMEFLVFYFQHRGKPLLRGLWSCPDRSSFSLNVLVPSGTALPHRLLLCTSDLNPFKAGLHFDLLSSSFPHKQTWLCCCADPESDQKVS